MEHLPKSCEHGFPISRKDEIELELGERCMTNWDGDGGDDGEPDYGFQALLDELDELDRRGE